MVARYGAVGTQHGASAGSRLLIFMNVRSSSPTPKDVGNRQQDRGDTTVTEQGQVGTQRGASWEGTDV